MTKAEKYFRKAALEVGITSLAALARTAGLKYQTFRKRFRCPKDFVVWELISLSETLELELDELIKGIL